LVSELISPGPGEIESRTAARARLGWSTYWSLLAAAVLVPLGILGIGAWLAWSQVWQRAESELARTVDAAVEYAAHLLDGHRLLADRVDDLLHGLTDEEIRAREAELHAALRRMAAERPWLLTLYAIDAEGRPMVSANVFPVPRDADLRDRDFFQALSGRATPPAYISKIHIGRFDGQLFFSVAERRGQATARDSGVKPMPGQDAPATFRGVVLASLRPNELAEHLRRLSGQPEDVLALVRTDGELLTRSTGFDRPPPPLAAESPMRPVMTSGADRAVVRGRSTVDGMERIAAFKRVEGWPVYASAARARNTIVARWWQTVALQLGFAVPAIGGLVLMVGFTYRRSREAAEAREALRVEATRRAAAEALRESEEHLRLAQEAGGVGTWEWDPIRAVATCSEGYRKLYGLDPKGPGHQSPEDWLAQVHPDDRDRVQWFRGSLTSGRIQNEYRIVRPDGSVRWIVDRGVPIYDSEGKLVRVFGANVDITEAREAEERLRELQSQVLHASRLSAMGQMAAALAHELNQPLGAATNFLNAARMILRAATPDGSERALARLEKAAEQTVRAGAILRRLRDFVTRGEADKRVVSARGLVEDAVALALVGKQHPALRTRLDFDPADPWILADSIQIQQVVFNLVRNALEAMEGRPARELVVATRGVGTSEVEISVADSGSGLPPDLETLFRPFETSKATGMGIGLSICRTIVEAHGGHLWAEPRPGGGALFRFTVPAAPAREARDDERAHHSRGG
jgi:PAS domain S-box-containing protein